MSADLLIPFGISSETGEFVEPEEAVQGRSCNCLCPGCKMPLLSRHPKDSDKRVHFAHDTRSPNADKSTIEECPFNSVLAVKMMAQHVANQLTEKVLKLPEFWYDVKNPHGLIMHSVKVTDEQELSVVEALVDTSYNGTQYDLEIKSMNGINVFVWLEYDTRPLPVLEAEFDSEYHPSALLSVNLKSFNTESFKKTKRSFSDVVKDFLLKDGDRRWVFHPHTNTAVQQHEEDRRNYSTSMTDRVRKSGRNPYVQQKPSLRHQDAFQQNRPPIPPPPLVPQDYQCLSCSVKWTHSGYGAPVCPKGCGHLYSRKL